MMKEKIDVAIKIMQRAMKKHDAIDGQKREIKKMSEKKYNLLSVEMCC